MWMSEVELSFVLFLSYLFEPIHIELSDKRSHRVLVEYLGQDSGGELLATFNDKGLSLLIPADDLRELIGLSGLMLTSNSS